MKVWASKRKNKKKLSQKKQKCNKATKDVRGTVERANNAIRKTLKQLVAWNRRTQNIGKKECCEQDEEQEG